MSLVGSLEDLGLGDLMQIISLSRKSGILVLRSRRGEGRVVFRTGELRGARLKGEPSDLRELLVKRGVLAQAEVDRLFERAGARGVSFEDVLLGEAALLPERLDELRRDHVEQLVLRMFGWPTGEFSFESQTEEEEEADELGLSPGINPQFLALEGTRLQDEGSGFGGVDEIEDGDEDPEAGDGWDVGEVSDEASRSSEECQAPQARGSCATRPEGAPVPPVIAIDPDLAILEQIKSVLSDAFPRVHIFQRSELGITRIRQYLARAETPLLLLSERAPSDPLTGARDWREILGRLKAHVPRMPVFLMGEEGPEGESVPAEVEWVAGLPTPSRPDPSEFVSRLYERLECWHDGPATVPGPGASAPGLPELSLDTLSGLEALAGIGSHPSGPGDLLALVMRCAVQSFSRVAIFLVRDGLAVGAAQTGLPAAGGPDDAGIRDLALSVQDPAWFRRAIESGAAGSSPASDEGDQRLGILLGEGPPSEAYIAPLKSGGRTVALLYADNLPADSPAGETDSLETLLREAGAALESAVEPSAPE